MPSSWDVYYVVFLSAFLALGIPALLAVASRVIGSSRSSRVSKESKKGTPSLEEWTGSPGSPLGERINARFFLAVNAALVLIALGLALIPCVSILNNPENAAGTGRALVAVVTLAGFAGMGLLYAAKKGDLSWIGSFRKTDSSSNNEGPHA